jgi:hypothetical protein
VVPLPMCLCNIDSSNSRICFYIKLGFTFVFIVGTHTQVTSIQQIVPKQCHISVVYISSYNKNMVIIFLK